MKKHHLITTLLFVLFIGVAGWVFVDYYAESLRNKNEVAEIQKIAYNSGNNDNENAYVANIDISGKTALSTTEGVAISSEIQGTAYLSNTISQGINIENLKEVNPDIFAWINVPGTAIDYPIAQHPTNDEFYLKHGADGMKSDYGCPYIELCDSTSFDDFITIVYGHNMNNGSMFAGLHNFEDQSFYDEHRDIYVYTSEHVYSYEVFAAVLYSDDYIPYCFDDMSVSDRLAFIDSIKSENIKNHSIVSEDVSVDADSKILTLSTCDKNYRDNRYLVVAVMKTIDGQGV